ncbi:MAG: YhdP family phospholipid transporter [Gammaproteobacteria bacterium]
MRKVLRRCSWWFFIGCTCLGVALMALQWLTPLLDNYAASFQTYLSQRLKTPVHIKAIHASWWMLRPNIVLEGVDIHRPQKNEEIDFHVKALKVRIDLLRSLWRRHMVTSTIAVDGAQLHVPLSFFKKPSTGAGATDYHKIVWFLSQRHWLVTNSELIVEEGNKGSLPLHLQAFDVENHGKRHHVHGKLQWGSDGVLKVEANLRARPYHLNRLHGIVNMQGKHIHLGSLQSIVMQLTNKPVAIEKGQLGFTFNGALQQSQWEKIKSNFQVSQLALTYKQQAMGVDVFNGQLNWDKQKRKSQWIQGDFRDAHVVDKSNQWEVKHINGEIKWLPTLHQMIGGIKGDHVQVNMNGWPAPLQNLYVWSQWRFSHKQGVPELRLLKGMVKQRKLQAQLEGTVRFTPQGPVASALGRVVTKPLGNREWFNHIPTAWLSPELYAWLTKAIEQVGPTESHFVLQGPLNRFPFDNEEGTFMVSTQYSGLNLNYLSPWPVLTEGEGTLSFHNRRFELNNHSGKISGFTVENLQASINDLGKDDKPLLLIKSEGQGTLQQGMDFLKNSPLRRRMGNLVNALTIKGDMALQLALSIPLGKNDAKKNIEVLGQVGMKKGSITIPQWDIQINKVKGDLAFTADSLQSESIKGEWQGGKVFANVSTLKNPQQRLTKIQVQGQALSNALVARMPGLNKNLLTGQTPFQLNALLTDSGLQSLQVQSSLQGLGVQLFAPFTKAPEAITPSQLSLSFHHEKPIKMQFNMGKIFNGIFTFEQNKGHTQLRSGAVKLGSELAHLPENHVLTLNGELNKVDVAQWWPLLSSMKPPSSNPSTLIKPRIDFTIEDLNLWGQHFHHMILKGDDSKNGWQLQVESKATKGSINLPTDDIASPLQVSLDYLYLTPPAADSPSRTASSFPLEHMPALDFICEDFHLGKRQFGRVRLVMTPHHGDMTVDWLSSDTKYYNLLAQGEWSSSGSHLVGDVKLFDIADTLRYWQILDNVHGKQGNLHFDLQWPQGLFASTLPALQGNVDVQLGAGRIEGLSSDAEQKLDMGRLVTLLNLRSIPKRLAFDFSDLTHDGLSYDALKGNFALKNGILTTNNTYLDGSVTRVDMKGEVDLLEKQYDLLFKVVPHYTSSLPLVATLAGGPVAGLATWVVDKALSREVDKMVAQRYMVRGAWNNPIIETIKQE